MNSISVFNNGVTQREPSAAQDLQSVATAIRTAPSLKRLTGDYRSREVKEEREAFKKTLPLVTFSGVFTTRKNDALVSHSGYICVDLDHIGTPEFIKSVQDLIVSFYTPALMFISPSGDGLKVVFKIDTTQGTHLEFFTALSSFFATEIHTPIDEACKDVSRACFLCHDADAFYSDTPSILGRDFIDKYTATRPTAQTADKNSLFDSLRQWTEERVSFVEGHRNEYVTALAGACNRFGIDEGYVLSQLETLASSGFTAEEIQKTVRSVYNNSQWFNTANQLGDLPEVTPVEEEIQPTPPFPIAGLPEVLQKIIRECSRTYGTHQDYWSAAVLVASCLALGKNFKVQNKYTNGAVLWICLVGKTGVGKTEPLRFAFRPFHRLDNDSIAYYEKKLAEYENIKRMDKKSRAAAGFYEVPEMPVCRRFILSDTTPEAMYNVHRHNLRGICLERDELKGWIDDFGRYNKSGEVALWLQSWSEQPITIDRKSDTPMKIMEPFICVTGGMQPEALSSLAEDNRSVNGFMQRLCFAFPDRAERPRFTNDILPSIYAEQYEQYIANLLSVNNTETEYISLSPEAEELYQEWNDANTDIMNRLDDDYLLGLRAKLPIMVLRLGLVIHYSHWAVDGVELPDITREDMQSAIDIAEYFRLTGEKVARELNRSSARGLNKKVIAEYLHLEVGYNQNDVAKILKVSRQYISKIFKNGKSG